MNLKKSQSAVEMTVLTGFMGAILAGSLFLLSAYAGSTNDQIALRNFEQIGDSFVRNSELVMIYGEPSRIVVDYTFPGNMLNMTLEENHIFIFKIQLADGETYLAFPTKNNISATFTESDYSEGKKKFLFEAKNDSVAISRW